MRTPAHQVVGTGEPLLLLSPFALPASALDRVKAPLSAHFTCITFDYPGSGVERSPVLPLTIPGLAASAVRVLDDLGYESAHVYGMSMGGLVAQELAIRFPERVRGLVLGATTPGGPHAAHPPLRTVMTGVSRIKPRVGAPSNPRFSAAVYQGFAALLHDTSTRLPRVQAKTLIIHGTRDRLVPMPNARLLHEGIPGSTLTVLPGGSHFYAFDDPDEAAAVVLRWFRESAPFPVNTRGNTSKILEGTNWAMVLPLAGARATCTAGRLALTALRRLFPRLVRRA